MLQWGNGDPRFFILLRPHRKCRIFWIHFPFCLDSVYSVEKYNKWYNCPSHLAAGGISRETFRKDLSISSLGRDLFLRFQFLDPGLIITRVDRAVKAWTGRILTRSRNCQTPSLMPSIMSIRAIITGLANNQPGLEIKCHSDSVSRHRHITPARDNTIIHPLQRQGRDQRLCSALFYLWQLGYSLMSCSNYHQIAPL